MKDNRRATGDSRGGTKDPIDDAVFAGRAQNGMALLGDRRKKARERARKILNQDGGKKNVAEN